MFQSRKSLHHINLNKYQYQLRIQKATQTNRCVPNYNPQLVLALRIQKATQTNRCLPNYNPQLVPSEVEIDEMERFPRLEHLARGD
ncbi:hypothetical protein R1flu_015164 [Riccia fluitans]|uniref:Uncharacterized protein n=1 Tax=Riccia fluitans TaxID=41844 RepID=A0ABD1YIF5_9MARC